MSVEESRQIIIQGAKENNLKNIDISINHNALTVVSGVSGSGKSSLVFDVIYKEGRRRYLESFSAHARMMLGKLSRPDVEIISGVSPTISVDQKSFSHNPRSTVGTLSGLWDYLRLLFARIGKTTNQNINLSRNLFSFNSTKGACPTCKGLGVEDKIDINKLVENSRKTLREGALTITTPNGYIMYSQVTLDVLNQVCEANGFNIDIPWNELTYEQKHIILYGSDKIKVPFGKHTLESRMKWTGITAKPREEGFYKGIIPVMEQILKRDRNKNILRFVKSVECSECKGLRLNYDALQVTVSGKNIAQIAGMTINELNTFFETIEFAPNEKEVGNTVRKALLNRSHIMQKLGLGYLTLDRASDTISGGEARRLRLSTQVGTGLNGITYILDEPSIGLHPKDNKAMIEVLKNLRDKGNTVIVVEHDLETIANADYLIDIGPAAGINGGEIIYNGQLISNINNHNSLTIDYLNGKKQIPSPDKRRNGNAQPIIIKKANLHNLKNITIEFKAGVFNVVTGVSGAGKTSLVHGVLRKNISRKANISDENNTNTEIIGREAIDKVIEVDQSPIGRTPRSNPATYTKLFDIVRNIFASQPESKQKGWKKGRFSFNVKGGSCEKCGGAGALQIGMHFLGDVDIVCPKCNGKRFNDETLEVKYKGKNIYEVLKLTVDQAVTFFSDYPKALKIVTTLQELGLGYINLGQSATTFSGGEAQRIKLASELSRQDTGNTLYILDEPTTGLHNADIEILLKSINKLVDKGNTVIAIEHTPEFVIQADHIVDLGPDSGIEGGKLIASGTPEEIMKVNASYTGKALKTYLTSKGYLNHISDKQLNLKSQNRNIVFKEITTNNLKSVNVEIPYGKITVITGVSGSGKSSLAFDTLFSEGQYRFADSFSAYARTMLNRFGKADFSECHGLTPTIAINRSNTTHNPRSTVGTMTEIYDLFRLLFSRVANYLYQSKNKVYTASMFSFNHESGACESCNGLGHIKTCSPQLLVTHPDLPLINGALKGTKTGKFYGDTSGQYVHILKAVGEIHEIDFERPYNQLSDKAIQIAMYGTDDKIYDVTWKYKRKNREGEHQFSGKWLGFVNYVNDEYNRKHADKRGDALIALMVETKCQTCKGMRLKNDVLDIKFGGFNIGSLTSMPVKKALVFFNEINSLPETKRIDDNLMKITLQVREEISQRLNFLIEAGLSYLTIDRRSDSLSGGEAQRVRLASQLGAELTGITYILDEPTTGLHPKDTLRLLGLIRKLTSKGNTVVVIEHDEDVIRAADHIIDMGPGAGINGGQVIAKGTVSEIMSNPQSLTGIYLSGKKKVEVHKSERKITTHIEIGGAYCNNLKNIDLRIPNNSINVVTGVSGSGKSSLVFGVIEASAKAGKSIGCESISGFENFTSIKGADQSPVGKNPLSSVATYTGIFDNIRDLFAKTELAKQLNLKKTHFSTNSKGGRCETCMGTGKIRISMDFMPDVYNTCDECHGKRFQEKILKCHYKGLSINEVLQTSINKAVVLFNNEKKLNQKLQILRDFGLGYLQTGQTLLTLSGGEAQRLKLANALITGSKNTLFLLDEPSTGLHFEDIERLMQTINRLTQEGNTFIIVEHNKDIIKSADNRIELGPEGGVGGGKLIEINPNN